LESAANGKSLHRKPVDQDHDSKRYDADINKLVVFCQPAGQIDIKVWLFRVGVLSRQQSHRANRSAYQQHHAFQYQKTDTDPNPMIDLVCDHGIQKIKDHDIEKYPDQRVERFDKDELGVVGHTHCWYMVLGIGFWGR
jgi:hypothetical protein